MDSQSQNSQTASWSCEVRSLSHVLVTLLTLPPGAGHNMMNERSPDAKASELSDLQTIEDRLGEEADKLGLRLYIAQSNVEGNFIVLQPLDLADRSHLQATSSITYTPPVNTPS